MAAVYFFQDGALFLHREGEILVILATLAFFRKFSHFLVPSLQTCSGAQKLLNIRYAHEMSSSKLVSVYF